MNNQYKVRTIKCKGCGKEITKRMPQGRKYCSLECYRNSKHPSRKNGEVIECEWCDKEVYKPKHQLENHKHHFCSIGCANKWQGRNKKTFICKTCGKEFKWSASRTKQYNPKYCSIECRDKDPNYQGYIKGNIVQQEKKGLNKIEKIGHEILEDLDIDYKEQALIADKFLVDVFIPKQNIVIQWDGDYWHGYGKSIDEVDDRVAKRMKLDKSQDAYMKKCGYKMLRFWEYQLKNNKQEVYANIKKTIQ